MDWTKSKLSVTLDSTRLGSSGCTAYDMVDINFPPEALLVRPVQST